MIINYRNIVLGFGVFGVALSSSQAATIVVTTNDAGGADAAVRATTPAVTEGNATAPISFDAANAPSALNIGAIALRFGVGKVGLKSSAALSFVHRRNNSTGFTLYGLVDSATDSAWAEGTLTANGVVASGWFTTDGSTLTPTASLVSLGTIGLAGTSSNTVRTFPNGGTEALPNAAIDSFLSADTDGSVTLLLVPSSGRSPFFYNREAAGTGLQAPTLSFTTVDAVPEPASLAAGAFLLAGLSRRVRRSSRD